MIFFKTVAIMARRGIAARRGAALGAARGRRAALRRGGATHLRQRRDTS